MAKARGPEHVTRPFAAGAFTFVVATSTDDDRALVESMFVDLPAPASTSDVARFDLVRRRPEQWTVTGPRVEAPAMALDHALKQLLTAVNLCALDAEPEHLHLHAAAAAKDGRVVVLVASRDTGKTTTVAQLVARGWSFITDETVRLTEGSTEVTGLPKPLSIKPQGRSMLPALDRWMLPPSESDDTYRIVPVGATGASVVDGGLPALFVVLLRMARGNESTAPIEPTVQFLHPADAVVALMQETIDAERFGATTALLGRMVAASTCAAITMGTPAQTVDEIERLFTRPAPEPLQVSVFPPSPAFTDGVTTVGIGNRMVVHNTVTGQIFALDEGGARVWRQLGGWASDHAIDIDGPVIASFVEQLRAFGVLTSSP